MFRARLLTTVALAGALALTTATATSLSSTVIVTGDTAAFENDPGGWMFNRDVTTATPFEFSLDAASIGRGSLYVLPIQNTFPGAGGRDKFIAEHFLLTPMDEVESISWDFQIGTNRNVPNDHKHFYFNAYANFPGQTGYGNCVYNVVPSFGSNTGFTTVTFDPQDVRPVRTTRAGSPATCPAIPADMPAGSTLRMFALNVGDTSFNDTGLDGYIDNVVVTTSSGTTVYDFESVPETIEACKNNGWRAFGFRNQGQCIKFVNTGK